jgi:hypothetical protein
VRDLCQDEGPERQFESGQDQLPPNDRVERPATMTVPRPDAAHDAPLSARTRC